MNRALSIPFAALLACALPACDDEDAAGPGPADATSDAQGDAVADAAPDAAADVALDTADTPEEQGEDPIGDGQADLGPEDTGLDGIGEDVLDAEPDAIQEDTSTEDASADPLEDAVGDVSADTADTANDTADATGDTEDTSSDTTADDAADGGDIGADGGDTGADGGDTGADGGDVTDTSGSDVADTGGEVAPFCGDGTVGEEEECDPAEPVTSCLEPDTCSECACQPDLLEGCPDATTVLNLLEFAVDGEINLWRHAGTGVDAPTLPGTAGVDGGIFAPPEGCSVPTGGVGGAEAFYTFVPPESGVYYFTTDVPGADTIDDTILYVTEGCVPGTGGELACSEDIAADNLRSELWVRLVAGQTFFVIVDAFTNADNGGPYALEAALVETLDVGEPCTVADPLVICDETEFQFCTEDDEGRETCAQYGERPVLTSLFVAEQGPQEGMSGIEFDVVDPGGDNAVCSVDGGTFDIVTWTLQGTGGDPLSVVLFRYAPIGTFAFPAPPEAVLDEGGNFSFNVSLCFFPGFIPFDPEIVSLAVMDDLAGRGVIGTWFTPFAALASDGGITGGRQSNFIDLVMTEPVCGDGEVTPGEPCDQSAVPNACPGPAEVCASCDFCATP